GRTDEFARQARQCQLSESDILLRDQVELGGVRPNGAQKNFPAHGADGIGKIDESDADQHSPPVNAFAALDELFPIETTPRVDLDVNQRSENNNDNGEQQ